MGKYKDYEKEFKQYLIIKNIHHQVIKAQYMIM